jgi:hypothetical protein
LLDSRRGDVLLAVLRHKHSWEWPDRMKIFGLPLDLSIEKLSRNV